MKKPSVVHEGVEAAKKAHAASEVGTLLYVSSYEPKLSVYRVGAQTFVCSPGITSVYLDNPKRNGTGSQPSRLKDITGEQWGKLTAATMVGMDGHGKSEWLFTCNCGGVKVVRADSVKSGGVQSCGCQASEAARNRDPEARVKHGHTVGGGPSDTYRAWDCMKTTAVKRGIGICGPWLKFENFLADMGERPGGTMLTRIDDAFVFSKHNCVWL